MNVLESFEKRDREEFDGTFLNQAYTLVESVMIEFDRKWRSWIARRCNIGDIFAECILVRVKSSIDWVSLNLSCLFVLDSVVDIDSNRIALGDRRLSDTSTVLVAVVRESSWIDCCFLSFSAWNSFIMVIISVAGPRSDSPWIDQ